MSYVALGVFALVLALCGVLAAFGLNRYQALRAADASERKAQAAQRERFTRAKPATDAEPPTSKRAQVTDFGRR